MEIGEVKGESEREWGKEGIEIRRERRGEGEGG